MRFASAKNQPTLGRALVALAMIGVFLLALLVADSLQLHERIHRTQGVEHVCAATILAGGGVENLATVFRVPDPTQAPEPFVFTATAVAPLLVPLDFLLLEHAPPALS
ncbi:MAG: hypothetical protein ABI233_09380 [Chthoniobacterales bacterium]